MERDPGGLENRNPKGQLNPIFSGGLAPIQEKGGAKAAPKTIIGISHSVCNSNVTFNRN
jgi:hypothetical protein